MYSAAPFALRSEQWSHLFVQVDGPDGLFTTGQRDAEFLGKYLVHGAGQVHLQDTVEKIHRQVCLFVDQRQIITDSQPTDGDHPAVRDSAPGFGPRAWAGFRNLFQKPGVLTNTGLIQFLSETGNPVQLMLQRHRFRCHDKSP